MIQVVISQDFNALGGIQRGLKRETRKTLRQFGDKVLDTAREYAKVDTGAYRASLYKKTSDFNGYEDAKTAAKALNPKANAFADIPEVTDELAVMFAIAVGYGYYVHEGQGVHLGDPNPVLRIGIDTHREYFRRVMTLMLNNLVRKSVDTALRAKGSSVRAYLAGTATGFAGTPLQVDLP